MEDNSEFKILGDAEHIRLRVGMYAGSTAMEQVSGLFFGKYQTLTIIPALTKIIGEILDNSIDEAIRTNFKFANKIDVTITNSDNPLEGNRSTVTIQDNGRGIPVEQIESPTGKIYKPVAAWTKARAGSNFGETRETIGANGVGSFLTNVLSTVFIGETADGNKRLKMVCNGMGSVSSVTVISDIKDRYTKVSFDPDLEFFGITEIDSDHINFIKDRIENIAACYPEITFTFNGEKIKFKSPKDYASKFCQHYVMHSDPKNLIVFGPSDDQEEFRLHSYVNGLWVRNGGTHENYITNKIIETLRAHIKKKHKIEVLPNAIRSHLTLVTVVRGFENLKFDSQTKERITNSTAELTAHFGHIDFDKLAKNILSTPEIIDPMIQAILYKKELQDLRELEKKKKKNAKKNVINHIAATSKDPQEKTLFLAEGLSAIGQLLNVRDSKIHGGYPLRGKVLNVRGMRPVEILKNKEIFELLSILNLEIGGSIDEMSYGTICVMTDADTDGDAIFCLLLNLFSNWPELFEQGRIKRLLTPLYVCTKGKQEKWFYTKEEFEAEDLKGYTVDYFKGLGTLTKEMYRKCIHEPRYVTIKGDLDILEMAFGDDADKRKEWMMQ